MSSSSATAAWHSLIGAAAVVAALVGCSDGSGDPSPSQVNTILPDESTPAPGACDDTQEQLGVPVIVIGDERTDATLGRASWECGNLTGDGFITFTYNPVLLDADEAVKVELDGDLEVQIDWSLGEPFTERDDGEFVSSQPTTGCSRLIIGVASPSGRSTATYGADIRVGGKGVACPQRELDPSDPDITDPFVTDTAPS